MKWMLAHYVYPGKCNGVYAQELTLSHVAIGSIVPVIVPLVLSVCHKTGKHLFR